MILNRQHEELDAITVRPVAFDSHVRLNAQ